MTSPSQDRLFGSNSSLAIKAPCRVATTANITLSGAQTIDGVAVVADDRVLVKNQTDTTENGIYIADTSTWERSPDFDGSRDVAEGTLVKVNNGSAGSGFWYVSTTGTITPGTSSINFSMTSNGIAIISAFMLTMMDDANAAAALTTLGVSAFVQTVLNDADAATVMTTLGISAFAQTILDDANAAAVRTTLGLGTAAVAATGTAVGNVLTWQDVGSGVEGLVPGLVVGDAGTLDASVLGASFNVDTSASAAGGDWVAWFRHAGTAANNEALMRLEHFSNTQLPLPIFTGIANRGTTAAKTGISANDCLLVLDGRGYDGSAVDHGEYAVGVSDTAAQISFKAAENWSGTAHGSLIDMYTVANTTVTPVHRLRIDNAGRFLIGTTVTSGVGAGDIAIQNDRALRGINAAGTAALEMIQLTSGDDVSVGDATGDLIFSSATIGTTQTVSVGANDSGGAGYRLLRVPN